MTSSSTKSTAGEGRSAAHSASSAASSVVPACPQGLTICREDFLKAGFTSDAFLAQWSGEAASVAASTGRPRTLETLRDDLGIYLKVVYIIYYCGNIMA